MKKNKATFEDILQSFDEVEQALTKDDNEISVNKFFTYFQENFKLENGFEEWQILEAKRRIKRILEIIEGLKKNLQKRKVTLMENSRKLDNYSKASVLKHK